MPWAIGWPITQNMTSPTTVEPTIGMIMIGMIGRTNFGTFSRFSGHHDVPGQQAGHHRAQEAGRQLRLGRVGTSRCVASHPPTNPGTSPGLPAMALAMYPASTAGMSVNAATPIVSKVLQERGVREVRPLARHQWAFNAIDRGDHDPAAGDERDGERDAAEQVLADLDDRLFHGGSLVSAGAGVDGGQSAAGTTGARPMSGDRPPVVW